MTSPLNQHPLVRSRPLIRHAYRSLEDPCRILRADGDAVATTLKRRSTRSNPSTECPVATLLATGHSVDAGETDFISHSDHDLAHSIIHGLLGSATRLEKTYAEFERKNRTQLITEVDPKINRISAI